ncbi:MAG: transporter substrate-binding protein [Deltaproteobacteria bacterium]|nr:transporter substrate-binding protein [Deltaproteobacteria bacterium]
MSHAKPDSLSAIIGCICLLQLLAMLGLGNGATAPTPALLKAKQEAEARGSIFETSRDEILAKAKKEGRMRALSSLEGPTIKATADAFRSEYPFLNVHVEELTGSDANQRFVLEMKAGRAGNWDVAHMATDLYNEYHPYLKKFDMFGMAQQSVLRIPPQLIDPSNRNIIASTSALQVVAYNKKLLSSDKVPEAWEDFLKPDFKGQKFVADIRPTEIAALVPAWGLEKTLDFARRLGAQQPVWVRGGSRMLTAIMLGEYALFIGPNYHTVKRAQTKDPAGVLDFKIVEPVPTRLSDAAAVLTAAANPYAGLLWLEFLGSPKGQKIAEDMEPFAASIFIPGFAQEQVTRGKKLSVVDWNHFAKMPEYQTKVVEAYGFPKAERK